MLKYLTIGTRGSRLAVIQAELVADALRRLSPGLVIELKTIVTTGDKNTAPIPLDTVGKAWFTAEIEQALAAGDIDLAVHSLKDVPPEVPPGLMHLPVLERADPRDVLISTSEKKLGELPAGAVIGTDSLRRQALVLHSRPDLKVESVRGNVETRLHKLAGGDYDAVILAAAGLDRLDRAHEITEFLDPTQFIPAIGQGVLAAEVKISNTQLTALLKQLQHAPTLAAVAAEQAFARVVGGGCKLPVGCYARPNGDEIKLYGVVGESDGTTADIAESHGPARDGAKLAEALARRLSTGKQLA
jgi:hydroxymethylbilane synthase